MVQTNLLEVYLNHFFMCTLNYAGVWGPVLGSGGGRESPRIQAIWRQTKLFFRAHNIMTLVGEHSGFCFCFFFYVFKVHVRIHHDRSPDDGVGIVIFTWYHFYYITSNSEFYGQISYILTGSCRKYSYEMI